MSNLPLKIVSKAVGASGTEVIAGVIAEDHIQSLQGHEAAIIYNQMRRSDPQVRKILAAIMNPIKSAIWAVDAASDDERDVKAAALMEQILFKDICWTKHLHEALLFIPHGYSAFEVIHQNKEDPEFGTYTGLAQLGFRSQTTITQLRFDRITGKLLALRQQSFGDIHINEWIDADTMLIYFHEQEGDNLGFPLLRNLFGPWKRKELIQELKLIGIERFAIPTPILEVPANVKEDSDDYIRAQEILSKFVGAENAYIMRPKGWDLTLEHNTFDPKKVQSAIKYEDEAMAGAVLATFLELGIGGNSGAFALGDNLAEFFLNGIESLANAYLDTINGRLIPSLMKMNMPEVTVMPKLSYSGIKDVAGKEQMEIITGLSGAGIITPDEPLEDHTRKLFGLPKKAEGEMLENQESSENAQTPEEKQDPPGTAAADTTASGVSPNPPKESGALPDPPLNQQTTFSVSSKVNATPPKVQNIVHKLQTDDHVHLDPTGKSTGPARLDGDKHFHEVLDETGNPVGITSSDAFGPGHIHTTDQGNTSGPISEEQALEVHRKRDKKIKQMSLEGIKNPKQLITRDQIPLHDILKKGLRFTADKYIADVIKRYRELGPKRKLLATQKVKPGGLAKLRGAVRQQLALTGVDSLDLARRDVPAAKNVKLKDDRRILKILDPKGSIKLALSKEERKLPRREQILIQQQAAGITTRLGTDVTERAEFQFRASESSTNDFAVLESDMKKATDEFIDGQSPALAAANSAAMIVNETRNDFLFDDEVLREIQSFTFINPSPKSEICKALAGQTFSVTDSDFMRHQPPLHHNCKSYIRANLKTSKNQPKIDGLPTITREAQKSITLSQKINKGIFHARS